VASSDFNEQIGPLTADLIRPRHNCIVLQRLPFSVGPVGDVKYAFVLKR
jgi:hypothetical protein